MITDDEGSPMLVSEEFASALAKTEDKAELLEMAKINFENFQLANPHLLQHPLYALAKAQLDAGLGYGTVEENLAVAAAEKEKREGAPT